MSVYIVLFGAAVAILSMMHGTAVQHQLGSDSLTEEEINKLSADLANDSSLYYGGIVVTFIGIALSAL